ESYLSRFRYSRVYISDSEAECSGAKIYTQEADPTDSNPWKDVFNITVNAVGSYMSVCQDYYTWSQLVLCEVVIAGCPYGKYGNQCGLTCGHCDQATCSLKDGTCPGECDEQYIGSMCNKPCGDGCIGWSCYKNGTCTRGCLDGMYGGQCNSTCPENCTDNKCARDNGACNGCNTGKHGEFCELQCPTNCESWACGQTDGACVGMCVDGFWDDWCNATCPGNCAGGVCNKSRGQCDAGCLPGYWGHECRHECSSGCKDSVCAQSDGHCTAGCTEEFYGSTCTQRCGHCAEGVCDRNTGICGGVCEEGFWGANCDRDCPTNCLNSTCTMDGQCDVGCKDGYRGQTTCTDECEDGRYGTNCSSQCGKCRGGDGNCAHVDGTCLFGCSESYHGDSCHSVAGCPYGKYSDQCGLTCGHCDQATCGLVDGTCPGECDEQYMGPMCDKLCGVCTDYSCNKDGCTRGCVDGKYGVYCDQVCPVNCSSKTCERNGHCAGCVDGMYGDQCNATCPKNCKDNECAQDNGACSGCNKGHGQFCELQCPTNCESRACGQTDMACVGKCVDGFWGDWCNVTCPVSCTGGVCNKSRGQCDEGCLHGQWGDGCRHECSSGCKDSVCAQTDGHCTAGCTVEFYGAMCTQRCGHCVDGVCDRDTGICGGVCEEGYWGANCDHDCPTNCLNSTCTTDGQCDVGCKDGYRGQTTCTDECEDGRYGTNCSSQCGKCRGGDGNCAHVDGTCLLGCSESYHGDSCHLVAVTQDDVTVPVVGGVVGALAVAVVVVVLIIVMRRRRASKKPDVQRPEALTSLEECPTPGSRLVRYGPLLDHYAKPQVKVRPGGEVTARPGGEVTVRPGGNVDAVYVNSAVSTNDDNNYYNISSVPRGVLIDDLKEFIASRNTTDFTKLFKEIPYGAQFPHSAGQSEENELKNRFRNLYAYDHSRVHLGGSANDPNSDYINANYIDGCESERDYIASQGPKPDTLEDTWRMVVQEKCGKIVMLTNLLEGKSKKCERYWPLPGENVTYGDITLTLASEEERSFYTIRTINVRDTTDKKRETMNVQQFHFTAWPDHGVADPRQLVVFHRRVTQTNTSFSGPLLVHCSAGIGRTGTFIGLDALVTNGRVNKRIDISGYVAKMRRNRMNMVQTAAQFQLLHEALYEALMYPGSSIPRAEFVRRHGRLQRQIQKEFQILQNMLPAYLPDVYSEAKLDKNSRKNRNPSILPSNDHRVILSLGGGFTDNYINAVVVSGSVQNTQFLVTQLPLPDTTLDFWRMVCDHDSNAVVLLNPRDSEGKYSDILPTGDQVVECGHFEIKFSSSNTVSSNIKELFAIVENKKDGTRQEIKLLYTTSWLNEELPPSNQLILDLIENVNNWQIQKGVHPITVQCLEGVLCSGLYCAVSKLIQQIRVDQEIDVFQAVREMQICRPEFIQSEAQYKFCYDAVLEYLSKTEDNMYANV
ncbi:hypothetical protein ScPMuIL_001633, partial [Solemya velum]